ncbi:hypothetical protein H8959_007282 [Pygathrix nigripes]
MREGERVGTTGGRDGAYQKDGGAVGEVVRNQRMESTRGTGRERVVKEEAVNHAPGYWEAEKAEDREAPLGAKTGPVGHEFRAQGHARLKLDRWVTCGKSKLDSLAGEGGRKRCLLVATSLGAVDGFAVVSGLQGNGAQEIISKGLISALVWKLQMEQEEEFQELILDTLVLCLREDATEALGSNVVLVLKQKLLSVNENIRSKAAHALLNVSISREGKKQVCKFDVIPILVHLLKDPVEHVKSNAAGALMFATVITEGKYAALEAQAISPLLELLHSPMTVARLNATKALTMLAEAPEGREVLQGHVPTFRAMEVESYEKPQVAEALRRAARIAVSVIEFKP